MFGSGHFEPNRVHVCVDRRSEGSLYTVDYPVLHDCSVIGASASNTRMPTVPTLGPNLRYPGERRQSSVYHALG